MGSRDWENRFCGVLILQPTAFVWGESTWLTKG